VLLGLLRDEVPDGDLDLLLLTDSPELQAFPCRSRSAGESCPGRSEVQDEQYLGKIKLHVQVDCRGNASSARDRELRATQTKDRAKIASDLVNFIEHKDRIAVSAAATL